MKASRSLTIDYVLPRLKELFEGLRDVRVAIIFGSLARGSTSTHDIDVALKFAKKSTLLDLGYIVSKIAEVLGVNEDFIDIVDLDQAHPILLARIMKEGIIVKKDDECMRQLIERAARSLDALITLKMWCTLDPEPKPDKAILASRVEEIRRNCTFLKEDILSKDLSDLSYKDTLALERAMHRIVEAMLDVCRHLVSVHSLGLVESYGRYPEKLAEAGKMPKELASKIAKLAGLRNILVHRYLEIRLDILYEAAKEVVSEIAKEFIEWIRDLDP